MLHLQIRAVLAREHISEQSNLVKVLEQEGGSCSRPTLVLSLHTAASVCSSCFYSAGQVTALHVGMRACVFSLLFENIIHVNNAFEFCTLQASFLTLLKHSPQCLFPTSCPLKSYFFVFDDPLSPMRAAHLCTYPLEQWQPARDHTLKKTDSSLP